MIRPGSVMTVRPPSWVSRRALRKSSNRCGPRGAAPGTNGVRAWAGGGGAGSGGGPAGGARPTRGAAPGAIVWRPAAAREMARLSAEVEGRARRLAGPVVSAGQAAALPLEELAASGALEAPQQAERDAAEVPQQEVAAWDVAEAPRQ